LFTAVVVVGLCVFIIINRNGREEVFEKNVVQQDAGISVLSKIDPQQDSDNDGLKDWQEALWQTDRFNADSDGDGTIDGQEVELGRDPLNGELDDALSLKNYQPTGSFTEQVSQNLYGQYSILKQENVDISQETQRALVESSLLNNNLSLGITIYTYNDLEIDPQYTNHREYADKMGLVLVSTSPKASESSVMEIVQKSMVDGKPETLLQLAPIERRYAKFIAGALEIKVPIILAENHLLFINSLESTRASIAGLAEAATDPLKGMLSLSVYNNAVGSSVAAITNISSFYEQNGITFEQGEAGYIFLYGL